MMVIATIAASVAAVVFAGVMLLRGRSGDDRRVLDSATAGGVTVSIAADGRDSWELVFADAASKEPVAVTGVSAEAVMPAMGSMPQMTEPLSIEKRDAERYRARGNLMNGTWQIRIRFNGPAGPTQAVVEVNAS